MTRAQPIPVEIQTPHHRPDIQGLRAVAVLAVVAFHVGLPISGGFIGVDIFFVISGFVIAAMLARDGIQLGRFYWRRFKRLAPALGLVLAFTAIGSLLLQSPFGPQQITAQTAFGAVGLVANFVITATTADYFAAPAEANPLLHTWSLSVEEQFYLLFPALLLVTRFNRWAVALVAIGSFVAACAWGGFYSPVGRVWEFAVGALIALAPVRSPWLIARAPYIGTALIALSLWFVIPQLPWPGGWTLLPVVGTAFLLIGGNNPISRALGSRRMTWLGDRSYSLYLWHWPFIVFARVIWPEPWTGVPAALLSFVPALLAFRYVENPIRHWSPSKPLGRVLAAGVIGVPLIASAGLLALSTTVIGPALQRGPATSVRWEERINQIRFPCLGVASTEQCHQSQAEKPDVVIWGDSHGGHLFPGLAESLNVAWTGTKGEMAFEGWTKEYIERVKPSTVLVAYYWSRREPEQIVPAIDAIKALGARVVVMGDVPDFPFDAGVCAYPRSIILGPLCSHEYQDNYGETLKTIARETGSTYIETTSPFCNGTDCSMTRDGVMLYQDASHLTAEGSRRVAAVIARQIGD